MSNHHKFEPSHLRPETIEAVENGIHRKIDPKTGRVLEEEFSINHLKDMFVRVFRETTEDDKKKQPELTEKQKSDRIQAAFGEVFDRIMGTDSDDEQGPKPPAKAERSEDEKHEPQQSSSASGSGDSAPASPEESSEEEKKESLA